MAQPTTFLVVVRFELFPARVFYRASYRVLTRNSCWRTNNEQQMDNGRPDDRKT